MHEPSAAGDAPATTLSEGARSVTFECRASSARVVDVAYPAGADFDTHVHAEAYLCLAVEGSYVEWTGPTRRGVDGGRELLYREGSTHAVRTGAGGARLLHVTDPGGGAWGRSPGPLALGVLWQLAAVTRDLGRGGARDDDRLHLESLVLELGPTDTDDGPWLDALRHRIREEHARPLALGELARDAGRHPAHVARSFRARWGMTPGECLRRVRVAAAIRALATTTRPLSAVALDAGFADQSHMGRWMRRYVGLTPLQVRTRAAPGG